MSFREPINARGGAAALRARGVTLRLPGATSLVGPLALGGVVATTALISVAAARTGALLPQTARTAPAWLPGPLGATGVRLGAGSLALTLVAGYVCYVIAATSRRLDTRLLLGAILGMHLLVVLAPPLFSTDMFSYQAYGRLGALHGLNPYLLGPQAAAGDPVYSLVGWRWTSIATVYGPLFTAASYALAPVSVVASAFAYKGLAALASLLSLLLVWRIARLRGLDSRRAVALVGLNPLLVLYGVGGGHNDLLMVLPLLGGIYLVLRQQERTGAALMVTSAAIKLTGGLPLAFALAAGGRTAKDRRRRLIVGAAAAGAALAGLSVAMFGLAWLHLPATLHQVERQGPWGSFPGAIVKTLGLFSLRDEISAGLGVVSALTVVWLLRQVWRGRMEWIPAAGWAAVAVLCCATTLLPWYVVWVLPLAAVARDRRLWRASLALSAGALAIYVVANLPSLLPWSP